jgi:hypothetical protein
MRGGVILPCETCEVVHCVSEKKYEECKKLAEFQSNYPTMTIYVPTFEREGESRLK